MTARNNAEHAARDDNAAALSLLYTMRPPEGSPGGFPLICWSMARNAWRRVRPHPLSPSASFYYSGGSSPGLGSSIG